MITSLSGILRKKHPLEAIIDLHGMAFEILISTRTYDHLPHINESCSLFTHLVWREDQHYLVGFHSEEDRAWFRRLIKITGVGPKVTLAILSSLTPIQLREIIETDDSTRLIRVPGIGKKTAERILLELSDPQTKKWMQRLNDLDNPKEIIKSNIIVSVQDDIREALVSLGYNNGEIEKALKYLPKEGHLDSLLRQALHYLSGYKP